MRMPCRVTTGAPVRNRLGRTAATLAVPVAVLVVSCAGAAVAGTGPVAARSGMAQVPAQDCTPQNLSGCDGTDAPADPSLLRYCGPDGTCTPVAHHGTPRRGAHLRRAVAELTTIG